MFHARNGGDLGELKERATRLEETYVSRSLTTGSPS